MKASASPTECAVVQALSLMPTMVSGYSFSRGLMTWCDRPTPVTWGMWYRYIFRRLSATASITWR